MKWTHALPEKHRSKSWQEEEWGKKTSPFCWYFVLMFLCSRIKESILLFYMSLILVQQPVCSFSFCVPSLSMFDYNFCSCCFCEVFQISTMDMKNWSRTTFSHWQYLCAENLYYNLDTYNPTEPFRGVHSATSRLKNISAK